MDKCPCLLSFLEHHNSYKQHDQVQFCKRLPWYSTLTHLKTYHFKVFQQPTCVPFLCGQNNYSCLVHITSLHLCYVPFHGPQHKFIFCNTWHVINMVTEMKKVLLCVSMQLSVCGFELCNLAKNFLYTRLRNFFGSNVTLGIQTNTIEFLHLDTKLFCLWHIL